MPSTTTNIGLVRWTNLNDRYNSTELAENFLKIDLHDHTSGKGVQIPANGLMNLAVQTAKLDNLAVTTAKIANSAVTAAKIEPQQAWQAPTLTNGWANYGGSFATAGYMKDSLGFVHLRGLIRNGTVPSVALTLPVGYRPAMTSIFACSNGTIGYAARVDVGTGGQITVQTGVNTFVSLDGITFRAEA